MFPQEYEFNILFPMVEGILCWVCCLYIPHEESFKSVDEVGDIRRYTAVAIASANKNLSCSFIIEYAIVIRV
jgi:hypothetical protein